jgi:quercetin dioxygenase-like cupin family protein
VTVVPGEHLSFEDLPGRRSAGPFDEGDGTVRVVELVHGAPRTAHRHPHSDEYVYVVSGEGRLWVDGEWVRLAAGDLARIPRGTLHATVAESPTVRLVCFFAHPDLASNLEETDIPIGEEST